MNALPESATLAPSGPAHASGLLSGHSYYLHWGVIQISLTNFLIIVAMVVLFVLALLIPFPGGARADRSDEERSDVRR